jgi:hypothetical protein
MDPPRLETLVASCPLTFEASATWYAVNASVRLRCDSMSASVIGVGREPSPPAPLPEGEGSVRKAPLPLGEGLGRGFAARQ